MSRWQLMERKLWFFAAQNRIVQKLYCELNNISEKKVYNFNENNTNFIFTLECLIRESLCLVY